MTTALQTEEQVPVSLTQFALYFLKLGCIGFGGPIALVGYMQKDLVEFEEAWGYGRRSPSVAVVRYRAGSGQWPFGRTSAGAWTS